MYEYQSSQAIDIQELPDGGFVVGGVTSSPQSGYIMRLNSDGDTLWTQHLRESGVMLVNEIAIAPNSDVVFVGSGITQQPVDLSPVVGRFDNMGNEIWIRQYTEPEFQWIRSGRTICNALDSGFIVGAHNDATSTEPSLLLFKVDDGGEPEWITPFGGPDFQSVEALIPAHEGYAAVGYNNLVGEQIFAIRLMRISTNGDSLWANTYAESYECYGYGLVETPDLGFLIAGSVVTDPSNPANADVVVIRTDSAGNQQWDRRFGGAFWDDATDIVMNATGHYTVCGSSRSFSDTYDAYLMSIDSNGDSLWYGSYGGESSDAASALTLTSDGGYALCGGRLVPPEVVYWDDWVLRLSAEESIPPFPIAQPSTVTLHQNYPNPFNSSTTLRFSLDRPQEISLIVYDLTGRVVNRIFDGRFSQGYHEITYAVGDLPSGVYMVSLNSKLNQQTRKIILLK